MQRHQKMCCGLLAISMVLAACSEQPDVDDDGDLVGADDEVLVEQATRDDEAIEDVIDVVDVGAGIRRHVTRDSVEPTVEFVTHTGSYVAIWVAEDGSSATFEGVPADATSAMAELRADSPLELFLELAPEGMTAPPMLSRGRRFSELEVEAAERLARLSPEELVLVQDEVVVEPPEISLAASCSASQANAFYRDFRPGVLGNSEGVLEYTPSGYLAREARRRKDYQAFYQTTSNQWTPQQSSGGLWAAYMRASAKICSGSARLTMWWCYGNQATADHGCGEPGSSIYLTHGPFSMSAGGIGTYRVWPGGGIVRARLDQMGGASDRAIWSVMSSNSSWGAINNCYN